MPNFLYSVRRLASLMLMVNTGFKCQMVTKGLIGSHLLSYPLLSSPLLSSRSREERRQEEERRGGEDFSSPPLLSPLSVSSPLSSLLSPLISFLLFSSPLLSSLLLSYPLISLSTRILDLSVQFFLPSIWIYYLYCLSAVMAMSR